MTEYIKKSQNSPPLDEYNDEGEREKDNTYTK